MKSIFDPSFRYTPSLETDVRKTFARIRREQLTKTARAKTVLISDMGVKLTRLECPKKTVTMAEKLAKPVAKSFSA